MLTGEMSRHTTFKFCLDPTVEQHDVLARYAGASRFAFNQCLRMVKTALTQQRTVAGVAVPWTGFDLINVFNAWKKTEAAGRVLAVDEDGVAEVVVTGLSWRNQVCQQVFEEAAADVGNGLKAWSDSRAGKRKGRRVGFPRFKKKTGCSPAQAGTAWIVTPTRRRTWPAGATLTATTIEPRTPKQEAGPPTPADGTALTSTPRVPVKPTRTTREPTFRPHPRPEPTTPEKGGAKHSQELFDTLYRKSPHACGTDSPSRRSGSGAGRRA
jgi:hypothetical protein